MWIQYIKTEENSDEESSPYEDVFSDAKSNTTLGPYSSTVLKTGDMRRTLTGSMYVDIEWYIHARNPDMRECERTVSLRQDT